MTPISLPALMSLTRERAPLALTHPHPSPHHHRELKPFASEWDEKAHFPVDTFKKFAELGFAGISIRYDECFHASYTNPTHSLNTCTHLNYGRLCECT